MLVTNIHVNYINKIQTMFKLRSALKTTHLCGRRGGSILHIEDQPTTVVRIKIITFTLHTSILIELKHVDESSLNFSGDYFHIKSDDGRRHCINNYLKSPVRPAIRVEHKTWNGSLKTQPESMQWLQWGPASHSYIELKRLRPSLA